MGVVACAGEIPAAPQITRDGVSLQLEIAQPMQEGAETRFTLRLRDAATQTPIRNAHPAAWVDGRTADDADSDAACRRKASGFLSGDLLHAAALNLNAYYVLALNEDNSISVIDPQSGFGGSKLLTMVMLHGVGQDWLLTPKQTLWVSQPQAGEVALVDTGSWKVRTNIAVSAHPGKLALQPGGKRVWALTDDGVAVMDAESGQMLAAIDTGHGRHALAFADDGRSAYVSNADDNTISLIDTSALGKTRDLPGGKTPVAMAWSKRAQLLYVANAGDGQIMAYDAGGKQAGRIQSLAGISTIRFSPDGRFGFVLNPLRNKLDLIDAATNQIVQSADIADGPDQISFSERMAYIRRRHSEIMQIVLLDAIGQPGQPLALASFGNGQKAFDQGSGDSLADSVAQAPNSPAALLANPADKTIYYYQEGLSAPAGSFRNYGHEPRAVLVLDQSLQEREPGQYQASARLPRAGDYQLVFFLDSPKMLHCFPLTIHAAAAKPHLAHYAVGLTGSTADLQTGKKQVLRLSIRDTVSGLVLPGVPDLQVLLLHTADNQQMQLDAHELEAGIYGATFVPPGSGYYYVYFQAPSLGLIWNQSAPMALTVK
jgi:YVTN family beta-propeller protein